MNKYVNYEITTSTIWIVINLIIFVGSCVFLGILFKNKNIGTATYESGFVEKDKKLFFYTISYTAFFVTLLVISVQIIDIVTCLTLPEKMILNELKTYIEMK